MIYDHQKAVLAYKKTLDTIFLDINFLRTSKNEVLHTLKGGLEQIRLEKTVKLRKNHKVFLYLLVIMCIFFEGYGKGL